MRVAPCFELGQRIVQRQRSGAKIEIRAVDDLGAGPLEFPIRIVRRGFFAGFLCESQSQRGGVTAALRIGVEVEFELAQPRRSVGR